MKTDAPPSLPARTADRLRSWIAASGLVSGARLPPEHELMVQLDVSRTVLREAVAGLRAQGELTSRRGSGVFVARMADDGGIRVREEGEAVNPHAILNLLEVRLALEVEAAGLAARRRSASDLARIEAEFAGMEVARTRDELVARDFSFHVAIAAATGNPQFIYVIRQVGDRAFPRERGWSTPPANGERYAELRLHEHQSILRGIAEGDAVFARDAMRHHILASAQRFRAAIEANS